MTNSANYKRSILVTGCSTGIGWHCAKRLKQDGWRVFATARKAEDIARLDEAGIEGLYLDYCEKESIHRAFEQVLDKTGGKLDALFNNGAYGQAGAVEDLPTEALRLQFEANFFGWHELTNLVVPIMRQQGHGHIVHCSSVLGFIPLAWRGAYVASKYALEGLATTMRLELKGSGVHLSLIEPGPIESEFTHNGVSHFVEHIDQENSVHKISYAKQMERLQSGGGVDRFRLGPEAVYKKLDKALNSKNPDIYYMVTTPTYMMAIARRILPQSLMEKLLLRST